jgi:hypothetical protein
MKTKLFVLGREKGSGLFDFASPLFSLFLFFKQ